MRRGWEQSLIAHVVALIGLVILLVISRLDFTLTTGLIFAGSALVVVLGTIYSAYAWHRELKAMD